MTRVLVTGASSGIGAATALAFAREGFTVALCARREDRLAEVLEQCRTHAPESCMVVADLGGVDVLVNNAGVPKRRRTAARERGSGHIVNVSSMGAHMISWGTAAYAATKGALELFTEALYLELSSRGVHAHLLVPGTTRTEFSTEREGNDPPMTNPADATPPEAVAAAILACLDTDNFITFATEADATTAAGKTADPNAFLARMRDAVAGR